MAISAQDLDQVLFGLANSDTVFYSVGGAVLVVMAGIWGFSQVKKLLSGFDSEYMGDSSEGDNYVYTQDDWDSQWAELQASNNDLGYTNEEYDIMVNGGYEAQFDRENDNIYGRGSL